MAPGCSGCVGSTISLPMATRTCPCLDLYIYIYALCTATKIAGGGPTARPRLRGARWRGVWKLPIGGQNADLGGVFVTSFGEGVQYVAPAPPENSWASRAWVLELKLGRGPWWWQPFQGYARHGA